MLTKVLSVILSFLTLFFTSLPAAVGRLTGKKPDTV